jgi:hypothetical protein
MKVYKIRTRRYLDIKKRTKEVKKVHSRELINTKIYKVI